MPARARRSILSLVDVSGRIGTRGRLLLWSRLAAAAAMLAYAVAVWLTFDGQDAADAGRDSLADGHLRLAFVAMLVLQPLVGFAAGKVSFLVVPFPVVAAWWVERGDEPGYLVSLRQAAVMYALFVGLPVTGVGVLARRYIAERRRYGAVPPPM